MHYSEPRPADLRLRQEWANFFNIDPSKLTPLSQALFKGDIRAAIHLSRPNQITGIVPEDRHIAALFGDLEIVQRLCLHTLNVKHKWKVGPGSLTALHCAAIGGNRKIASLLISKGCPLHENLSGFGTPLALAALGQRLAVVDVLLKHCVGGTTKKGQPTISLDAECDGLGSVIHATSISGNSGFMEALVDDERVLETSQTVKLQHVRSLRKILYPRGTQDKAGPSQDPPAWGNDAKLECIKGQPLTIASYFDCEAIVEYFCTQTDVDINAPCSSSPLRSKQRPEAVRSHTAIDLASMQSNDAILALLLSSNECPKSGHDF